MRIPKKIFLRAQAFALVNDSNDSTPLVSAGDQTVSPAKRFAPRQCEELCTSIQKLVLLTE